MANNLSSNASNKLIGKLFDMVRDRLMQSQRGRWILGALFLVLGILSVLFAVATPTASQSLGFGIGAALFLALGLLVLVGNIMIGTSQGRLRKVVAESEARAKQLLAEGKILPLPPAATTTAAGHQSRRPCQSRDGRQPTARDPLGRPRDMS